MSTFKQFLPYVIIGLAIAGMIDSAYLTYEHYAQIVPPCSMNWWVDCGKVLKSSYSMFLGLVPLALLGVFQYTAELIVASYTAITGSKLAQKLLLFLTTVGVLFSAYFVYLMIFVIQAICLYCFASAIISLLLFTFTLIAYPQNRVPMIK
jgi:uncharacterized membrane protein